MSPYENRLRSENFRRVGLISNLRPGEASAISPDRLTPDAATRQRWQNLGLSNVSLHAQPTAEATWLFLYLEFAGDDPFAAAECIQQDPWFEPLRGYLIPHPRARAGHDWFPMELINIIGPTLPVDESTKIERSGLVVQLDPAKELTYRTLHQTNWPGVVDQMARSHRRYWITFLIEHGDTLWLFTYSEYLGSDPAADDAATAADPVTRRWWQHTQPCLIPISDAQGAWTRMQPLIISSSPSGNLT